MGCNCKNKAKKTELAQIKKEEILQEQNIALSTINEIEGLIDQVNTNSEARSRVSDFMYKTFGEVMVNYCDAPCRKRLLSRIEKLKLQIQGK